MNRGRPDQHGFRRAEPSTGEWRRRQAYGSSGWGIRTTKRPSPVPAYLRGARHAHRPPSPVCPCATPARRRSPSGSCRSCATCRSRRAAGRSSPPGRFYGCDGVTRELLARLPEAEYATPAGSARHPLGRPHRPAPPRDPGDARRRAGRPPAPPRRPVPRPAPRAGEPAPAHAAAGLTPQDRVQRRTTVSNGTSSSPSPGNLPSRYSRAERCTASWSAAGSSSTPL